MSIVIIILTTISIYTMFEILGRNRIRVNVTKFKNIHKFTGYIYFILSIVISYFCLSYIYLSRAELTPRSNLHSFLSLSVLVLFGSKLLIAKVYKQFYNYVNICGLLIALITFGIVGSSAGYYLIVSRFGTDDSFDKMAQYEKWADSQKKVETTEENARILNPANIARGKSLYSAKCGFCHDPYSLETKVGPGLKGVLQNSVLPLSRRPATSDNVRRQFRQPFSRMPSFVDLSDQEVDDIIAFLNTL